MTSSAFGGIDSSWQNMQIKVIYFLKVLLLLSAMDCQHNQDIKLFYLQSFGRWANTVLARRNIHINNLGEDFRDGFVLANLLQELSTNKNARPVNST